ncbi:uncharacterized protein LOC129774452 [Toxorhynchites rutilus septentrionalis]|uniref:uncharacterized protein LOC129774452 n=1 Tax=Toxorhynchites rutilus septentrionalis TaxID=329112 RepID=UPI00247B178F|nr:uncharacterized protein LOC129774452 [Toxorhynchites rutilus septentrionalis]
MELAKKRKATMLDKSGMLVVIEVWKDNILSLRSTSKNSHIYKQMCEELKGHGVILTAVELKNRINNLSRKYSTRDLMDEVIGSDDDYCDAEYLDEAYNPENDTFAQSMFMSPSAPTSSVSSPSPTLPSSSRRHSAPKEKKKYFNDQFTRSCSSYTE